jgi:hypothetical protein
MSMLQPSGHMLAAMAARGTGRPPVPVTCTSAPAAMAYPTYSGVGYHHQATYSQAMAGTAPLTHLFFLSVVFETWAWVAALGALQTHCTPGGCCCCGVARGGSFFGSGLWQNEVNGTRPPPFQRLPGALRAAQTPLRPPLPPLPHISDSDWRYPHGPVYLRRLTAGSPHSCVFRGSQLPHELKTLKTLVLRALWRSPGASAPLGVTHKPLFPVPYVWTSLLFPFAGAGYSHGGGGGGGGASASGSGAQPSYSLKRPAPMMDLAYGGEGFTDRPPSGPDSARVRRDEGGAYSLSARGEVVE